MAYDYIGIINEVCDGLNETPITSVEFDDLVGFLAHIKAKVNTAIKDIYTREDTKWPFAVTVGTQVTTVGLTGGVDGVVPEYSFPSDAYAADWSSFYVTRNDSLTNGDQQELKLMTWDVYKKTRRDDDANSEDDSHSKPFFVVRKTDNKFILTPLSEVAYTVKYDYYAVPDELSASTDVPAIPERFKQVIIDRLMYYAYMFRDNVEAATIANDQFKEGYRDMRRILVPQDNAIHYVD